jgi:hypothetical protein
MEDFVYSREKGEPKQEVGGVSTTLLSYCESAGINADLEEDNELKRVMSLPKEKFQKRQAAKDAIGTGQSRSRVAIARECAASFYLKPEGITGVIRDWIEGNIEDEDDEEVDEDVKALAVLLQEIYERGRRDQKEGAR